jgi:hypothetical protein
MATVAHWRRRVHQSLLQDPSVAEVLSPDAIDRHCRQAGHAWRDTFWSPTITLLTFLLQVLSAEKTLRAAVSALLSQLAGRGQTDLPSCDPSAYCQGRRRLPASGIDALSREMARHIEEQVGQTGRWRGHPLKIVDGSFVSMPDTPDLQKAFPQHKSQKPGCGFPLARIEVLFDWGAGILLNWAVDSLHTGELTLFRRHWDTWLQASDIVLADRHYCSYVDLARLQQRGVFALVRLHQRRKADFRKGRWLGPDDRLMVWFRPQQWLPSFGIDREAFEQLPQTLHVRYIRVRQAPKGFRSRTLVLATTLLDPVAYPADEIRSLYRDRWTVELNLRSLKTHLGLEVLRGQSQDVVRKEIAMHFLAYNLIRLLMWRAATEHGRDLHRLSFTGTLHRLRTTLPVLVGLSKRNAAVLLRHLLKWIASDRVPDRPNRFEPRRKKRRPKPHRLLTKPRAWYRRHLESISC